MELARRNLAQCEGLLLDLNGVFYVDDAAIPGGRAAIERLRSRGLACRFTTNTTTSSLDTLHRKLNSLDLPIQKDEIFTPAQAAVVYIRREFGDDPALHLLLDEDTKRDFADFRQDHTNPDAIVIGDIGDRWNYQIMQRLFEMVTTFGARIIALHKGRYWQAGAPSGLRLDIGAFIAGLEYATGKPAVVIGKPETSFFEMARADLKLSGESLAMIGDDIESDVGGAQRAGLKGILVKTGKYRPEMVARSAVRPDGVLESIADLAHLL
ncbi:MAG: TIGR01458 family HAD-type hydrolase [bacterium]|nr:TIGR01458 family HAD-type hydrolase [bacterium]